MKLRRRSRLLFAMLGVGYWTIGWLLFTRKIRRLPAPWSRRNCHRPVHVSGSAILCHQRVGSWLPPSDGSPSARPFCDETAPLARFCALAGVFVSLAMILMKSFHLCQAIFPVGNGSLLEPGFSPVS